MFPIPRLCQLSRVTSTPWLVNSMSMGAMGFNRKLVWIFRYDTPSNRCHSAVANGPVGLPP